MRQTYIQLPKTEKVLVLQLKLCSRKTDILSFSAGSDCGGKLEIESWVHHRLGLRTDSYSCVTAAIQSYIAPSTLEEEYIALCEACSDIKINQNPYCWGWFHTWQANCPVLQQLRRCNFGWKLRDYVPRKTYQPQYDFLKECNTVGTTDLQDFASEKIWLMVYPAVDKKLVWDTSRIIWHKIVEVI